MLRRDRLTHRQWRWLRPLALLGISLLLAVQPTGLLAMAQESTPTMFVVGVHAATLRAEPHGASLAVAIVPSGSIVSAAGPELVTAGVTWRHVRTAEGLVGYLPAGFLTWNGVGAAPDRAAPAQSASIGSAAPSGSVGAVASAANVPAPAQENAAVAVAPPGAASFAPAPPAPSTASYPPSAAPNAGAQSPVAPPAPSAASQPSPMQAAAPTAPTSAPGAPVGAAGAARQPTPTASPAIPTTRTTVERRRGQNVTIVQQAEQTAPDGLPMGAGRIVVKFKAGATAQGQAAAHQAARTTATRPTGRAEVQVAQVDPNGVSQALAAYRSRADVEFAEPDYVRRVTLTPTDPRFPQQWGPLKIGVPIAWDVTTGSNAKVALLDSGIYSDSSTFLFPGDGLPGHPDLRGRVVLERNFSTAVDADDWYGHGTLMAGIIGARVNNTPLPEGIAGIGFNVQLLNGKVLDDTGNGFDSSVAQGIIWAADNGARVISMSLSGPGPCSQTLQDAINYAWTKNVVLFAAAGNGGADVIGDPAPEAPANCTNVVAIGAIDQNDVRPTFSNFGLAVPLAAPGTDILSSDNVGGYSLVRGTSPATPHVSAVASLLLSTTHGTTNQAIVNRLFQTADPIVGAGVTWRHGRVNAAAAVGPTSCTPRPAVTVTMAGNGTALNVVARSNGVGNAVRFIRSGAAAGNVVNALAVFPTGVSQGAGTTTYVPQTVGTTTTFQVKRATPGLGSTLPFIVMDGCGPWNSFAGGGPGAGF